MSNTATDFFFDNMGRFEQLDHDHHIKLAIIVQAWQQHPDGPESAPYIVRLKGKAARDKMVRHNLRLIVHIWRNNYAARMPINHPGLVDAFQSAAIDLTRAAEKYVPSKSKFSTYAATWIHKGLKGYLAGEDRLVRIPSNNVHLIKAAQALISRAKMEGRTVPTSEEIVEELGKTRRNVPKADVMATWLKAYHATDAMSYDVQIGTSDSDSTSMCDMIRDDRAQSDDDADAVRRAIKFLGDQEREVISRRYLAAKPELLKNLGKEMGVSESQVHVIERRAIDSIRNLARVN